MFTAHSVPEAMAAGSGPPPGGRYPAQLAEAARLIAERVNGRAAPAGEAPAGEAPAGEALAGGSPAGGTARGGHPWRLVYQSRSGPPSQPWLGPDVCDYLEELAGDGAPGAVLVPVGFISDHLEVVHDLDVEAAEAARRLGLPLARAATPGTDPRFVSMITALVSERRGSQPPRAALGSPGCGSADCCRPPAPGGQARPPGGGLMSGGLMSGAS